jgi:CRISPR/Cas system-associated protein Cas5 (RAMP superfamily)
MNNTQSKQNKIANKQAKRLRKIKALKAEAKELTDAFRKDLRIATQEEFVTILDKLGKYKANAMKGVNTDFRLSDEQEVEMALHIIDIEDSLNTKEGKKMVSDSLANAERVKSFKISEARKGTDEITASASWIVGK